jgi:cell division septation protein DedD
MSKQEILERLRKDGFNAYINKDGRIVIQGNGGEKCEKIRL